jgi:hypothetical protein
MLRIMRIGLCVPVVLLAGALLTKAQAPSPTARPQEASTIGAHPPLHPYDDELLQWPLSPANKAYAAIDGRKLKEYDAEVVAIRERYRDQGHQFWGTITGTSSDVDTQQWVLNKFKQIGLEILVVPHDLPPQWIPNSWEVTASANGKTIQFPSAMPANNAPGTPLAGLDLEAVYVGTGSEADFAGRDVRGKAVVIYNSVRNHAVYSALTERSAKRAEDKGAAAILLIYNEPGNLRAFLYRMWPNGANVPTFSIGLDDGFAFRGLIEGSLSGPHARVRVRLDAPMVPNLKTATILGTLPGATDEKIFVNAHRDGIFYGAVDNASGLAAMMGLAEYLAKIPKEQRRRTVVFAATTGHHSDCNAGDKVPCSISMNWLVEHHDEELKNTALTINLEHVAPAQTNKLMGTIRRSTTQGEPLYWYVKGSPKLRELAFQTYREFGVPVYAEEDSRSIGDMDPLEPFAPMLNLVSLGLYSHTDGEQLENIAWTQLQGVTRAVAKIITEANKINIDGLQPPSQSGAIGQR